MVLKTGAVEEQPAPDLPTVVGGQGQPAAWETAPQPHLYPSGGPCAVEEEAKEQNVTAASPHCNVTGTPWASGQHPGSPITLPSCMEP